MGPAERAESWGWLALLCGELGLNVTLGKPSRLRARGQSPEMFTSLPAVLLLASGDVTVPCTYGPVIPDHPISSCPKGGRKAFFTLAGAKWACDALTACIGITARLLLVVRTTHGADPVAHVHRMAVAATMLPKEAPQDL